MGLYRCAACGSSNVVSDTQVGGFEYNYKKGIVGTIILGTGGAAAGVTSGKQTVYKCADCGLSLTYPMNDEMKFLIDFGVQNVNARGNLKFSGLPISWATIKRKYKNIEQDAEIKENFQNNNVDGVSSVSKEEFDFALFVISDITGRLGDTIFKTDLSENNPMSIGEYYLFMDAISIFIENMEKYLGINYDTEKYLESICRKNGLTYLDLGLTSEDIGEDVEDAEISIRKIYEEDIKGYLKAYIEWKIFLETAKHVALEKDAEGLYKKFIRNNPFVIRFANKYIGKKYNKRREKEDWNADNIVTKGLLEYKWITPDFSSPNIDCFGNRSDFYYDTRFKIVPEDKVLKILKDEKNIDSLRKLIPKYIELEGVLYSWKKFSYDEYEKARDYYFSCFPERKIEYDKEVESILKLDESLNQKKIVEAGIEDIEKEVASLNEENNILNKKIFGRKAALEQISKNKDSIKNKEEKLHKLIEKKNELEDIINNYGFKSKVESVDSIIDKFYKTLVESMDYFVVWQEVKEQKYAPDYEHIRIMIQGKMQDEKVGLNTEEVEGNTSNLEEASKQIKIYKDLLDAGVITEKEFTEKKKQLLGI